MFGSSVLDIGIGLVLTYLFLSLVVTAANELLATTTRARATDLERGIRNLLDGKSDVPERWWDTVLRHFRAWRAGKKSSLPPTPEKWSEDFFNHPLIYALSQDDAKPCYVPSQTFATVLMHLVQRSSGADPSPAMASAIKAASDFAITKKNDAEAPITSAKDAEDALKTAIDALQAAKKEAADAEAAAHVAQAKSDNADQASRGAAEEEARARAAQASQAKTTAVTKAAAADSASQTAQTKAAAADSANAAARAATDTVNQLKARLAPGPLNFDEIRAAIEKIDNQYIKHALLPLVEEARSDTTIGLADLKKLTVQIEIWFDHAMDRVSGWYIRRTKWFLIVIAIVFTVALNVDTVAICRRLGKDDTLRASVVESAKQFAAQAAKDGVANQPGQAANDPHNLALGLKHVQAEVGRLNGLGIPLGWTYDPIPSDKDVAKATEAALSAAKEQQTAQGKLDEAKADAKKPPLDITKQATLNVATFRFQSAEKKSSSANEILEQTLTKNISGHPVAREDDWHDVCNNGYLFFWTKVCGLFLTAFAASLGAPFWFDVLNKFMSVRGSGKAPEEKPKDPKIVLQPRPPEEKPSSNAGKS